MSGGSVTAFAPARVRMLGDDADAPGGHALAFAIAAGVTVRATTLPGPLMMVRWTAGRESDVFDAWRPGAPGDARGWRALVRGTAAELQAVGLPVRAARLELSADVPPGGALGASTALAAAVALALLALSGEDDADPLTVARICSRVAETWGGAPAGFPAPHASLLGRDGHALHIDARADRAVLVPFALGQWSVALAPACAGPVPSGPLARHGGEDPAAERDRIEAGVAALRAGDLRRLAEVLEESHAARRARLDGGVSELDRTVQRCRERGAAAVRLLGPSGRRLLVLLPPGAPLPRGGLRVVPSAGARLR